MSWQLAIATLERAARVVRRRGLSGSQADMTEMTRMTRSGHAAHHIRRPHATITQD
jgi:acetolactate synthase regulatory subunit